MPRRLTRTLFVVLLAITVISGGSWLWRRGTPDYYELNKVPPPGDVDKAMVLAKVRGEDIMWAYNMKPDWTPYVYSASKPAERGFDLIPSGYRGREAITYLDFIIDNYDSLPGVTAFVHAKKEQWHNEDLGPWTSTILENLRLDTVKRRGYVNLRCKHDPGCPVGVNPLEPTEIDIKGKDIRAYFADVYMELFNVPASKVPEHVGNVCCGQFVVSRERIRERPLKDYVRMRRWALESTVTHSFGVGWVFEKIWHIIFGMDATYCPEPDVCRCELFGWCGPLPEGMGIVDAKAHYTKAEEAKKEMRRDL